MLIRKSSLKPYVPSTRRHGNTAICIYPRRKASKFDKLRNSRRTGTAEDTGDLDELSGLLGGIHLGVGLDDSEGLTGCVKMAFWGGWQKLKPFVKIDGFAACVGWVSVLG